MSLALLGGAPVRTRPFPAWPVYGQLEEQALADVLHSGFWGGYNDSIQKLEQRFAALHQAPHAISCANGTVALEVVLRACGIGCGDEVIVPAFTFVATATAVLLCHAQPVFADIERDSLNLDPAAVAAAITPRTRAIIAVHFGGRPADMDSLAPLARQRGLTLIEDAAHAHGARWRERPVGNFGEAGTFSFQAFKLMTAGEGGIMTTNSAPLAERMWSYCNQGRRPQGGWFEHFTLGSNYRITGFQAALLCAQLERLEEQNRRRQANAAHLRRQLAGFAGLRLAPEDPRVGNDPHYLVTLRYDAEAFAGLPRDRFIEAVRAEGVPLVATYPRPLYHNPVFHNGAGRCHCTARVPPQDYRHLSLPESERACRDGIWIEHHLLLGESGDVDDMIAAFAKVQENAASLARASVGSGA